MLLFKLLLSAGHAIPITLSPSPPFFSFFFFIFFQLPDTTFFINGHMDEQETRRNGIGNLEEGLGLLGN